MIMASKDGAFRFRVSDAVQVPLRGMLLRLRLLEGTPSIKDVAVGRRLRLSAPDGSTREVGIMAHPVTAGKQTQARLERTRELDVLVETDDAVIDGMPADIGWLVSGPVAANP
jgi:hypothetical protein